MFFTTHTHIYNSCLLNTTDGGVLNPFDRCHMSNTESIIILPRPHEPSQRAFVSRCKKDGAFVFVSTVGGLSVGRRGISLADRVGKEAQREREGGECVIIMRIPWDKRHPNRCSPPGTYTHLLHAHLLRYWSRVKTVWLVRAPWLSSALLLAMSLPNANDLLTAPHTSIWSIWR